MRVVRSCTLLHVASHLALLLARNPLAGAEQVGLLLRVVHEEGPRCCRRRTQTCNRLTTSRCRWWIISRQSAQLPSGQIPATSPLSHEPRPSLCRDRPLCANVHLGALLVVPSKQRLIVCAALEASWRVWSTDHLHPSSWNLDGTPSLATAHRIEPSSTQTLKTTSTHGCFYCKFLSQGKQGRTKKGRKKKRKNRGIFFFADDEICTVNPEQGKLHLAECGRHHLVGWVDHPQPLGLHDAPGATKQLPLPRHKRGGNTTCGTRQP